MTGELEYGNLPQETMCSLYYTHQALNYSWNSNGPLSSHGIMNYEVKWMDRSNALQMYHLNLLEAWREVVPEWEELGSKVNLKGAAQFTIGPCEEHLSLSQGAQVARLQREFTNMFFASCLDITLHHFKIFPGVDVHSHLYQSWKHTKNGFRMSSGLCLIWE